MSDCTSTQTSNTSACLDSNASEQPAGKRYDESCESTPTTKTSACLGLDVNEQAVEEHPFGECYDLGLDGNEQDVEEHPFGECYDETCCDPATLYHCEDEISYYRNKGMVFQDRGDGTGDWCYTGGSVFMGKGTGVVFED